MNDLVNQAKLILLDQTDVDQSALEVLLGRTLSRDIDMADIFLQSSEEETWFLENSIVRSADYSVDKGFGLRVVSGEKMGFAYADNVVLASLEQAASSAKSIVSGGDPKIFQVKPHGAPPSFYQQSPVLSSIADEQKVALLKRMDQYARSRDPRVQNVFVRMTATFEAVMVLDSEGGWQADIRPLVHLSIRVIVKAKDRVEQGSAGGGARADLCYFLVDDQAMRYVDKAVRQALLNLEAVPVPAGNMPVVLGPGWPAVLLHEAVGHGLEADFNRKGSSVFSHCLGQRVASPLCTIVDDATIDRARGSLNVDDEGTPGQQTVLIEKGILKGYMTDRHNARLLNMAPTGNGRRESYAHPPLPRMTSTYMLKGDSDPEDMIKSVSKGLYAVDFAGGQVDITSGKFVFTMSEAYLIENGKLGAPVKGATLIGNGSDVLAQISMVGHDFALDPGIGFCGKDGQSVPVGVGQPSLKVNEITVGGTAPAK